MLAFPKALRVRIWVAPIAAAGLLAACAQPTPYQQADNGRNGYDAQKIADDRWRVSFDGNSLTPRAAVEDYLLYRVAEIAEAQGAERFVIAERETEPSTRLRVSTFGAGFGRSRVFGGATFPAEARPFIRYTAYLELRLLEEDDEGDGADVYHAASLISAIEPRVLLAEGG